MGYLDRYLAGEHEQVWAELVELGATVREEPLYSDALAVARETMRRVRHNIEVLIARLRELGYAFGYSWAIQRGVVTPGEAREMEQDEPVFSAPPADVAALTEEVERRAGTLPLSLRAFYEVVGGVNFVGSHPDWGSHRLDPLEVMSAGSILRLDDWNHWSDDRHDDGSSELPIAPDEYFKYLFSGGEPYAIPLQGQVADASLLHEWHRTTYVNYLRICFRWGGFPGLERIPDPPLRDLAYLTEGLLPL